jgi:hypothetical protein
MAADARWWTPLYAPHRLAEAALQPKAQSLFFAGTGALAIGAGFS